MTDYFVIGKIVNTQGVKGEVRVMPTTDDINRFKKLSSLDIFKLNKSKSKVLDTKTLEIQSVRFHKQFVLVKFKDIDDMTEAEKLRDFEIRISKDLAISCEEDEYFISDLYDMKVIADDGEFLGTLDDIIFTAANDVYIIKNTSINEDGENITTELLIPAIKQCILKVNISENTMTVHLLEGLR